jgi:hypothetical protein
LKFVYVRNVFPLSIYDARMHPRVELKKLCDAVDGSNVACVVVFVDPVSQELISSETITYFDKLNLKETETKL